ncbi:class I adenylate-forming enzyme family protein [Acrocarpospora catenulata]|uniref:class I adenylate-forming enzyme family protein n=1 Tax=Acrocarpospora catenulata TaxID=2836182 RepID=UPI001BDA7857|nr:AMP-binding protein [Acrocarpospora catenulata]
MRDGAATLWPVFRGSLLRNGDRPALAFGTRTWTYDQLSRTVAGAVGVLDGAGVRPGDRVVLLTGNHPAFPVYDLATMAVGGVKVPLSPALTADEVSGIVARVRPRAIVVSPELRDRYAGLDLTAVERLAEAPAQDLPREAGTSPDDPAVIYFTGGTTGQPKGVVHTQAATVTNLWAHLLDGGIGRDERLLLTTPLAHAAGLFTLAALLRGAYARVEPGFDTAAALDRIDTDRATWMFAVPTMIYRLLDLAAERGWRPATLRTLQYGAAPISAARLRQALGRFGPVLQQLYAQTECPNYAAVLHKEDHLRALTEPELMGSAGRASIMCELSIRDDAGAETEPGTPGEVCVRSPYTMRGYWDGESGDRFHGSWLRTGDIGYLDAEGFLFLVDRRNDMIVSGGMNVYSIEVEQALLTHPQVTAAAVVGVPHEDWGEAVHAVIVGDAEPGELAEHCRAALASYKRPKSYEFAAELPLTRYGKIDKRALRLPHWADHHRGIS